MWWLILLIYYNMILKNKQTGSFMRKCSSIKPNIFSPVVSECQYVMMFSSVITRGWLAVSLACVGTRQLQIQALAGPRAGRRSPVSQPSHLAAFPSAFFFCCAMIRSLWNVSLSSRGLPGCVSGYFSAIKGEMETRLIASERKVALYPNRVRVCRVLYNYL